MGSGQGVKKDVGRDGPGQPLVLPVRLGRGLPGHACLQELAKEQIEGGSAGSRLQQETARPGARNDRSQPSPMMAHCRHMALGACCFCQLHVRAAMRLGSLVGQKRRG